MQLPKRYYLLDNVLEQKFIEGIDLAFFGNSKEVRAHKIHSLLSKKFKGKSYQINYDVEKEKYTLLEFFGEYAQNEGDLDSGGKELTVDFINELKGLGIDGKTVLIDITSIKHPLVFYLVLVLKKYFNPKNLYVCYTEPEKYDTIKGEEVEEVFDLTDRFCEVNSLPGFVRISEHTKDKLLVAVMGFEGSRFNKAFGDVNPSARKTYAIVGFPSFHPNWQYYVYSKNKISIEQSKASGKLIRNTANEPFGVYNSLQKVHDENLEFEMFVAPIGTKPHSLGVSMFAVDNDDVQLYYDFPSHGKKVRTFGVGKSFLYNLTDYINES